MSEFPVITSIRESRGDWAALSDSERYATVYASEPRRPGDVLEFSATDDDADASDVTISLSRGGQFISLQEPNGLRYEITTDDVGVSFSLVVHARGVGAWHAHRTGTDVEHDAAAQFIFRVNPPQS